jgi:hypothetical protein
MLVAIDGVRLASTNVRGGPRASALGCVGIEGSQTNQAGAEIRDLRRLRLPIDGETLFSQTFGLTVGPAWESGHESSVHLYDPPVGDFAARVMRNGLKGPLGGNGACSPDIELPGKRLAKKIGRDEFASRDLRYQGRYGRRTRQQHFSWTAKKSQAGRRNLHDGVFAKFHVFLLLIAFCFGRSGRIARKLELISS